MKKLVVQSVSAQKAAEKHLQQNAIRFDGSARLDAGEAFPFFYAFVREVPLSDGIEDFDDPATLAHNAFAGISADGVLVPAGTSSEPGRADVHIRMDTDYNFDLLEVRYMAKPDGAAAREFFAGSTPSPNQFGFPEYKSHPYRFRTPFYEYLRVSLFVRSGIARDLFGGASVLNRNGDKTFKEEPIVISAMQGSDDGKGCLRVPHLISKGAVVTVRVQNFRTTTMRVDGCLFGYKVSH